jgi:hypothetical protein
MNRIFQFTISYLGLLPYIYFLSDLYIFKLIDSKIIINLIIFNTIIIYTFIGAIHWQWLQKDGSTIYTIHGFIPSLVSFFITIMTLLEFDKGNLLVFLIIFLLIQLMLDFLCYLNNKLDYKVMYFLRIPITTSLCVILIIPVLFNNY